jgi:hypothetical protein
MTSADAGRQNPAAIKTKNANRAIRRTDISFIPDTGKDILAGTPFNRFF